MGRKIPAKKHRGVKDPWAQQAKRVESLKGKINAPPADPDEQPVPKSLLRLFGLEDSRGARLGPGDKQTPRRVAAGGAGAGAGGGVSRLRRLAGESARSFSRRITAATRALHGHQQLHYPVEEEEEEETAPRRRRRGAGAAGGKPRPSRADKRKLRLKEKKEKLAETRATREAGAMEVRWERLPFGECAHAPPALPAPRLPAALRPAPGAAASAPRPGRRDLLLTHMLAGEGGEAGKGAGKAGAGAGAGRVVAELRRLDAVAAYRALKAQRRAAPAPAPPGLRASPRQRQHTNKHSTL